MSFLNQVAFQGMKVVMKMDEEARGQGRKGPPDGATGMLLKRTRYIEYRQRYGHDRSVSEPGIYERDGAWLAVMDDPTLGDVIDGFETPLILAGSDFDVHESSRAEYQRRRDELWNEPVNLLKTISSFDQEAILDNRVRTGDLPETKAWQLDTLIPLDGLRDEDSDLRFVVTSVAYHADVLHYDVMAFNHEGRSCFSTAFRDEDIKEIVRGNLWKSEHNEPLVFSDLNEEATFAKGLGKCHQLVNPASDLYKWTLDEFSEAVKADLADGMTNSFIPFTSTQSIRAFRFTDRELGERVRQETIKGFDLDHFPTAA
ncbi:hypothetical protein [Rhizobium sp. MHM7A]|uniref:hypothetical protein n=1 Tax=Rhizobium sp. MHM7A TaxID=2583233 RepID=UPI0011073F55|nr:hypothetical protein [Rhizobium sp. MHM7A]TLX16553.1 hypothetical protein FFR93_04235 [Rhizobium sp. MHM7A]